jgi:hypothetical protein
MAVPPGFSYVVGKTWPNFRMSLDAADEEPGADERVKIQPDGVS